MPLGGRRIGRPGLVGTMARTAVISGTATAVSGGVARRQAARHAPQQQVYQEPAYQEPAPQAPPAPAPTAGGGDDVLAKLQQLADLKAQGILDDAEFAAAKAQLLGT
ncbi:SHOCT domain-containing protein [Salsipaludibacter albus]|uniref:SHOCT domain-containing protein n=1 Tax=Salsipaludibacter albus TaxID=2849650 RepID=UPI001EE3F201|nr:SHOCT domain-containing protein [Salsipaludibacter albus]MBY5162711.1 SHOCT domain-containing protein [Salsipaludibacter albus]